MTDIQKGAFQVLPSSYGYRERGKLEAKDVELAKSFFHRRLVIHTYKKYVK